MHTNTVKTNCAYASAQTAEISAAIYPLLSKNALLLSLKEVINASLLSTDANFLNSGVDLNQYLIKPTSSSALALINGFSLEDAGINEKDALMVDKSLEPTDGKIAVCIIDGEFVLKRLKVDKLGVWLMPNSSM